MLMEEAKTNTIEWTIVCGWCVVDFEKKSIRQRISSRENPGKSKYVNK